MAGQRPIAFPAGPLVAMRPPRTRPSPPEFERFATPSPPRLGEVAVSRDYPAKFELTRQGDPALCVFLIESGMVKLIMGHADGRPDRIVALRGRGWVLGADAVIAHEPYVATTITLAPSKVAKLPADEFLRLLESDRELAKHIHQMHAREVTAGHTQLGDESTPAKVRLLSLLADLTSAFKPDPRTDEVRVKVPLRQLEIAQLLGVAPQYLSKLLKEMEGEGVLRRAKDGIVVYHAKLNLQRPEMN
jgi:CRP-like cAMP-binding protein